MEAHLPAIEQAVGAAMAALGSGSARLQLVGRPTAGKSSALREIASRLGAAGRRAVLLDTPRPTSTSSSSRIADDAAPVLLRRRRRARR